MTSRGSDNKALPNDLEMLDDLISKYFSELMKTVEENAKLGDLIKMIELRRKLAPGDSEQKQFWRMLDKIRRETLPAGGKSGGTKTRRSRTGRAGKATTGHAKRRK